MCDKAETYELLLKLAIAKQAPVAAHPGASSGKLNN